MNVTVALLALAALIGFASKARGTTPPRSGAPEPPAPPPPSPAEPAAPGTPAGQLPGLLDPWEAEEAAAAERAKAYPTPAASWRFEVGSELLLEPSRMYAGIIDLSWPESTASDATVLEKLSELVPWAAAFVTSDPKKVPKDWPRHALPLLAEEDSSVRYAYGTPGERRHFRERPSVIKHLVSRALLSFER